MKKKQNWQQAISNKQWAVRSAQCAAGSGQWAIENRKSKIRNWQSAVDTPPSALRPPHSMSVGWQFAFCLLSFCLFVILFLPPVYSFQLLPAPQNILYQGNVLEIDRTKIYASPQLKTHHKNVVKSLSQLFPSIKFDKNIKPPYTLVYSAYKKDKITNSYCKRLKCENINPENFDEQEYFLGIKKIKQINQDVTLILILSHAPVGEFYAIKTLKQIYENETLTEIIIRDKPQFKARGVLEGFYGKAWPQSKRETILPWMADYKFNIFLYTPKDDYKLRFGWRTSLNEKELSAVKKINDIAKENFIKYCWSLSPGLSIRFSSSKDYETIIKKYSKMIDLGVNCFTIAFDDVNPTLLPDDLSVYKTYWEAQVDFANKLIKDLKKKNPDVVMAFVPNDYWGDLAATSEYLRYLGKHLDTSYQQIGWTGNGIGSKTIMMEDAKYFAEFIKRKPALGDNYPVMDNINVSGRLHIGPLRGRDPRLFKYIELYAANAMPLPEASKPALLTIADFSWNPLQYDPDASWEKAWKILSGEKGFPHLYFFAQQSQSSFIWEREAPELQENIRNLWNGFENKPEYNFNDAFQKLQEMFSKFASIEENITRNVENKIFIDEIQPWINKLSQYGKSGLIALDLLKTKYNREKIDRKKITELENSFEATKKNQAIITKKIMDNFINRTLATVQDLPIPAEEKYKSLMGE